MARRSLLLDYYSGECYYYSGEDEDLKGHLLANHSGARLGTYGEPVP